MAQMNCEKCGERVSDKAEACSHCGVPVPKSIPQEGAAAGEPEDGRASGWLKVLGIPFGILVLILLGISTYNTREVERIRKATALELAEEGQWQEEQFIAHVEEHYQQLLSFYEEGSLPSAMQRVREFETYGKLDYKDVALYSKKIRIEMLEEEIQDIPAPEAEDNLRIYKELAQLDPGNVVYQGKLEFYRAKVKEEQKRKARKKARIGPIPSHPKDLVREYLERNLNDPESLRIEAWSSSIYETRDGYVVACEYRAKSPIGGYEREHSEFLIAHNEVVAVTELGTHLHPADSLEWSR